MPAAKVLEPEPAQGPRKAPERVRTQRTGPERHKPERTGPARARPERTRPERAGPERTRPERTGAGRGRPERTSRERARPERPGPERARPERTGPERARPERVNGDAQLRVPAVRNGRTRSCPRDQDRDLDLGQGRAASSRRDREVPGPTRRTRSSSAVASRPPGKRTGPEPAQRELRRGVRTEDSHKAFTVFPPNPKKRRDIQRKAEAELAALEDLRLSRALSYVSISPSSVGGCLTLQQVRLRQQQEMLQARRTLNPVKKQLLMVSS
ncbi:transmembrane protease serine 13 [Salarias fasciatus]|uniref:transmembrane protease serine 13 n=1 Tax=Salarias fasciatus TaxID=181472 RepID=UPI0011768029|nr:transmembrane protease serine 13-like [Salarias fasciatus]